MSHSWSLTPFFAASSLPFCSSLSRFLVSSCTTSSSFFSCGMVFSSVRAMPTAMSWFPASMPPRIPPLPSFSSFSASSGTSSSVRLL